MANGEQSTKMVNGAIKIAGYLEKKGKKRMVPSTWKKYWFVLEGRLLLYYKSYSEVTNLRPCHGSINMGLATDVRPLISPTHNLTGVYMFEIVTHINNTVLLRTKEKSEQEKWLQALLDALGQPKILLNSTNLSHFRYSMDNLMQTKQFGEKIELKRQNTLPQNIKCTQIQRRETFLDRIRRIRGNHSRSLDTILKESESIRDKINLRIDDSIHESSSDSEKESAEPGEAISESNSTVNINNNDITLDNKEIGKCSKIIQETDENKNCVLIENDEYCHDVNIDTENETANICKISRGDSELTINNNSIENINNFESTMEDTTVETSIDSTIQTNEMINTKHESERKKKKKFGINFKFKSKEEEKTKDVKVKRKSSFLNKFFKHHKKKNSNTSTDFEFDSIDVDSTKGSENGTSESLSEKTECVVVESRKVFGALEVIAPETLRELNERLKPDRNNDKINQKLDREQFHQNEIFIESVEIHQSNYSEECPQLPPRRGSRSRPRSPWHDVPTNNTPYSKPPCHRENIVSPYFYNNDINATFGSLEEHKTSKLSSSDSLECCSSHNESDHEIKPKLYSKTSKKVPIKYNDSATAESSELTVRQLINKFNQCETCVNSSKRETTKKVAVDDDGDVTLRNRNCNNCHMEQFRNSDELNQLLNELTKITTAPLVQPRVTNSLIQVTTQTQYTSSGPLSDEEWLALAPIRRRRFSEPDYDVPRSHRSLDFVPPLPSERNLSNNIDVSAQFFDTSIHNQNSTSTTRDSIEPPSIAWSRSITPDSLEATEISPKKREDELDRSVGSETYVHNNRTLLPIREKLCIKKEHDRNIHLISERFFDSLEQSTLF